MATMKEIRIQMMFREEKLCNGCTANTTAMMRPIQRTKRRKRD